MRARWMLALIVGVGISVSALSPASAAISQSESLSTRENFVEARQYDIANGRVAGQVSAHQTVTAWQVTTGSWNGQALDGLTLVLVETTSDDGRFPTTMNCYVSHMATPAQRQALLTAYTASRSDGSAQQPDQSMWRVEPAVIRFELMGRTLTLHLGAIG